MARDWRGWALAGALAGLACGVKLTAVVMVVGGVVVGWAGLAVARFVKRAPQAERLNVSGIGVFVLSAVVVSSPWLIRNVTWTGNPVFPEGMEVLGKAHFSDVQVERWRRAHSPREDQRPVLKRLLAAWKVIAADWRYGFAFLPLAVAAGLLVRDRRALFLGLLVLFQLIVWLAFTHLQGRFFILAIPPGAILIGLGREKLWPALAALFIVGVALVNLRWHDGLWRHDGRFDLVRKVPAILGQERLQTIAERRLGLDEGTQLPTEQPLILVGDAQAFFYSEVPAGRLRYRTVFDVPPPSKEGDWLGAWAGDEKGLVLVFPGELARFKRTYYAVPAPSDAELEAKPGPYGISR
jgi:hypothetical protein